MRNGKTWIRILCGLLVAVIFLSIFCVSAFADGPKTAGGIQAGELSAGATQLSSLQRTWSHLRIQLRRLWYQLSRNGDNVINFLVFIAVFIVLPILTKSKKKGAAQKKSSVESAAGTAKKMQADWRNMAREVSQQRAEMAAERGLNKKPSAARRPDPRMKSFTKPDAPCIVCDHTGEDHFMRDRENRIKQLDEWLKNGLIDKTEYRIMKQRYERDQ